MKELVDESISILNRGSDLAEFGRLLHEAWQAKRSLSQSVSNPQVDDLYSAARAGGALGGKLTGAGGGGFLLLFVPPECHESVKERLHKLIHVPFRFEPGGSQIIFYEPGVDYSAEDEARNARQIEKFRELPMARAA